MKELSFFNCLSTSNSINVGTMSKSNPSALNGVLQAAGLETALRNHPPPDLSRGMLLDHHKQCQAVEGCLDRGGQHATNDSTTASSLSNSHRWSDYTLTGSVSGQYSTYSWGLDEVEIDRAATESVRRKLDRIGAALFEGRSTGCARVDMECREWSSKFPHLEVRGIHLLDSMEDGTEMVAPDPFLATSMPEESESQSSSSKLMIEGQKMRPCLLQNLDESSPLYEEVIAMDGNLEEFFAFDNMNEEVQVSESHRRSRLKRHHGLPPVTPSACIRDGVMNLAFNNLWAEVGSILQPLIAAIRENYSQGHESAYSLCDSTLTPTEPVLGAKGIQQEQLRGLRDQPTLTRAPGQTSSKLMGMKYSSSAIQHGFTPTVTLPQLTNLSGVMQIRSVPLQQRAHSSYVPNVLPINDMSRECTPTPTVISERPESSAVALRLTKLSTPLPRGSEYQVPTTPAPPPLALNMSNRLISSRMTNRRNINMATLKPIEKPKTPSLATIDNGIRGFKLGSNASHSSPPSTPFVRHTQLPPLEGGGAGGVMSSSVNNGHPMVLAADRSPVMQARISAQNQRNRVTFNSRIVSAADGTELWSLSRLSLIPGPSTGGVELRPSTTNTSSRHNMMMDPSKSNVGRKGSDNSLHFGRMKVVGYAAGFHGGGVSGVGDVREKVTSAVITEDEEVLEDEPSADFTVTGKSGFFQSKPRSVSSRTKSRGHIR